MKELQYLNKFFAKYKFQFLLGILITIVAQLFALFGPNYTGASVTAVQEFVKGTKTGNEVKDILVTSFLIILGATILRGILTFFMRQTLIVMSRHVEFDLKNEIFRQYENLSQNFYKQNRTGDLMNRISEDVNRVRQYVGPAIMYALNTIILFVVILTQMIIISPELTLYTVLPLPLLAWSIFWVANQINKRSTLVQQNLSSLSSYSQEMFSGIRVIKAYALEGLKQEGFTDLSRESKKRNMSLAFVGALFGPLMILLIGISNLVVLYVGGTMYINGEITNLGTIAQFILYINMLTWPVASIGWISGMVQEAEASQKRINEFLKIQPDIANNQPEHTPIAGNISFENVSFTYDDTGIHALKGVSFKINKGETLAILGRTGSGKSTVLSLISRLYDTTSGIVKVDGHDVRGLNLYDLRDSIGVVPQDAFLFSDSIENNIKFGKEDATHDEVVAVAKKAVVHHNIETFTHQYETILGERGITLSGGQKQRVSIARALIKDAPILLLDDCLSAVDTETEEAILSSLQEFAQDRTTIIVSHRVSSAKNADRIIILEDGKIIEEGTHNQLVSQQGYYKELYLKQLSEKELS
ncbi:ABC transporter [Flavobacterium akiainvivens]|uniref:ABC transporter n=1 Tax=Flavobacterium akiainvivens TaxID=1202724 RepID=A0A0M8MAI7_9FLAO|nr:ABC transporter ATP-binding protein [Flavobacterium akiainvivens]KOS06025.1 ABC transporter [Flavobacterium akiainvivens]SFQ54330.1 ATP-binding cassette, subfamily B [Flavobacterium akiainvivens]